MRDGCPLEEPGDVPSGRVRDLPTVTSPLQMLLQEVQTLRDQLCREDQARSSAAAERLLQVYRELRSPSILLL